MKEWNQRPREIANNFNPAFCGELIYTVLEEYEKIKEEGMPFLLFILILPIILHKDTRSKLNSSRTYMSVWLHKNPEVKINFAYRVNNLLDVTIETYMFLIQYGVITVKDGKIFLMERLSKRKTDTLHEETKMCIDKAKIIGKWFARNEDVATVYFMWGVRP